MCRLSSSAYQLSAGGCEVCTAHRRTQTHTHTRARIHTHTNARTVTSKYATHANTFAPRPTWMRVHRCQQRNVNPHSSRHSLRCLFLHHSNHFQLDRHSSRDPLHLHPVHQAQSKRRLSACDAKDSAKNAPAEDSGKLKRKVTSENNRPTHARHFQKTSSKI